MPSEKRKRTGEHGSATTEEQRVTRDSALKAGTICVVERIIPKYNSSDFNGIRSVRGVCCMYFTREFEKVRRDNFPVACSALCHCESSQATVVSSDRTVRVDVTTSGSGEMHTANRYGTDGEKRFENGGTRVHAIYYSDLP